MAKKRFTEDSWRDDPWFRALRSAFLACKTQEQMASFLRDIGTLSELQAWSERLEVAKQLSKGLSYRQVAANTGASTTTVTRVARFIENGEGGYRQYLKAQKRGVQMESDEAEQKEEKRPSGVRKAGELKKYLQ